MPPAIEFRCNTCGKLLRTGPENAGRPAACPGCGDRIEVPQETVEVGEKRLPQIEGTPEGRRPFRPHRGGLALAFGILAWATCPLFGVAAWAIAANDLRAMRAGEMDPSGEGLTRAGLILGALNVAMTVLAVVGMIVITALAATAR